MSRRDVVTAEIEDVGGGLASLYERATKEVNQRLSTVMLLGSGRLQRRMGDNAPVGPDSPHIATSVTFNHRGLRAEVGYIDGHYGDLQAGDDNDATIAEVALWNEYDPNQQPFIRRSAEEEAGSLGKLAIDALAALDLALAMRGAL